MSLGRSGLRAEGHRPQRKVETTAPEAPSRLYLATRILQPAGTLTS